MTGFRPELLAASAWTARAGWYSYDRVDNDGIPSTLATGWPPEAWKPTGTRRCAPATAPISPATATGPSNGGPGAGGRGAGDRGAPEIHDRGVTLDRPHAVGHEPGVVGVVGGHRRRVGGVEEVLEFAGELPQLLGTECVQRHGYCSFR
jgi:hypothetical protein